MARAPTPPPWHERTPLDQRAARRRRGLIALGLAVVTGGITLGLAAGRLSAAAIVLGLIALFLFAAAIAAAYPEH